MQHDGDAQGSPVLQVPLERERKFVPVREVARTLGVSEMTIRRAYAAGVISGITFGTSCRILAAFVASLVAEAEAGRQVKVEEFGRQWPVRSVAEAVA
jgi:excisionase family DNA binding protein